MDKNSNVGTQYIICECGDNFPDEKLLNIHLANDHGNVEVYQCDACSEYFSTKPLLHQHSCNHAAKEKSPPKISVKPKNDKKPPVIKLKNLKRIDSISLIQSLKSYSGLIKLEPAPQEMEYQVQEEPSQVLVKSEVQDQEVATEEIYYQCDVCNTIFYTESDFNIHYQTTHAMKVEPTPEEILEDHLVSDHIDNVNIKAEVEAEAVDTAYYYECEIATEKPKDTGNETSEMDLLVERKPRNRGRPKKKKRGRKPKTDVYADMPPGLSFSQIERVADERRYEIRRQSQRLSAIKYRQKNRDKSRQASANYASGHPEARGRASAKYAKSHPEVGRRSSAKYAKSHPEVGRKSSAKYAKSHPEVGRRSSAKYAEKKKNEKLLGIVKPDVKIEQNDFEELYVDCCVNENLKICEEDHILGV